MDILLIKLFVAHILGDFFFQFDSWVQEKEVKKLRSPKFYFHILIHGLLLLLLVCQSDFVLEILALTVLHGIIDALKLYLQTPSTKRAWFFADQLLHLISILMIWQWSTNAELKLDFLQDLIFWKNLAVILFLTFPSSIIIRVMVAKWTPNSTVLHPEKKVTSLQSAGKYIGIMERLLIFIFVYTNHFEAIGFLLAAKSIFRFGDLKEGNDLKLTEYILIGTLLSFGIAICISLLVARI